MRKNDFVDYVLKDLLSGIRGIRCRAMFGAYGVYQDDTIFGIIDEDMLYLKADDTHKRPFEEAGSQPLRDTSAKGKEIAGPYWTVPADILEDREELTRWVERAIDISRQPTGGNKK